MEYRKICNICGKIWCYTDEDIKQNTQNAGLAALSSMGAVANVLVGTRYDAYEQTKMSDRAMSKIKDYSKCPDCGSTEIRDVSAEEFRKMQKNIGLTKTISINPNASVDSIIKRIELFMEDKAWDEAEIYCEQALDLEPDNGYLWLLKLLIDNKWTIVDEALIVENQSVIVAIEASEYYERIKKFAEKDADLKKKLDKIKNDLNEYRYRNNVEDYSLISSDSDWHFYEAYENLKQRFLNIKDYKDSAKYVKLCQDKMSEIIYLGALKKLESDCIDEIEEAKAIFQNNSQWDDADSRIDECNEKLKVLDMERESKKRSTCDKIIIVSFVILVVVAVSASWIIKIINQI